MTTLDSPAVGAATRDGVVTPTLRARLRADRGLVVVVLLVLLGALLLALVQSRRTVGLLDPDATDPRGSHALAVLLQDQGVDVVRVASAQAAADALSTAEGGSTLVIAPTAPLSRAMVTTVEGAGPGITVLLSPPPDTLGSFAPWARESGSHGSPDEVPAACSWSVARLAGPLPQVATTYSTDRPDAQVCWDGGVLDAPAGSGTGAVTVVGMSDGFTNAHLGESGYAALATGTLGRSRTLVWWMPSTADPLQFDAGSDISIGDLVPSWVRWALVQLAIAVGVVVWWRGRRLGRVVVEPLPVVVRPTETVEGRGRLYRRGNARARAAEALRAATLRRLRTRLALPRTAPPDVVVAATAARTGRPAADLASLLTSASTPTDDAGLTGLADALDALENEVRRS